MMDYTSGRRVILCVHLTHFLGDTSGSVMHPCCEYLRFMPQLYPCHAVHMGCPCSLAVIVTWPHCNNDASTVHTLSIAVVLMVGVTCLMKRTMDSSTMMCMLDLGHRHDCLNTFVGSYWVWSGLPAFQAYFIWSEDMSYSLDLFPLSWQVDACGMCRRPLRCIGVSSIWRYSCEVLRLCSEAADFAPRGFAKLWSSAASMSSIISEKWVLGS